MTSEHDLYFEVITPLGFKVSITNAYWEYIISTKHPYINGMKKDAVSPWKILISFVGAKSTKTFTCSTGK